MVDPPAARPAKTSAKARCLSDLLPADSPHHVFRSQRHPKSVVRSGAMRELVNGHLVRWKGCKPIRRDPFSSGRYAKEMPGGRLKKAANSNGHPFVWKRPRRAGPERGRFDPTSPACSKIPLIPDRSLLPIDRNRFGSERMDTLEGLGRRILGGPDRRNYQAGGVLFVASCPGGSVFRRVA